MATIINTPRNADTSDSFMDIVLGIILLLVIVGIFFFYALPAIERRNDSSLQAPQNDGIDINVQLREDRQNVLPTPASGVDRVDTEAPSVSPTP
jgi:septal ring-binding cell division protein DamX